MHEQMYPARVEAVLYDLCVELGLCLDQKHQQRLLDDPPSEIDAFADAVMRAEGLDLDDPKWARLRLQAREICRPHFEEYWRNIAR